LLGSELTHRVDTCHRRAAATGQLRTLSSRPEGGHLPAYLGPPLFRNCWNAVALDPVRVHGPSPTGSHTRAAR